MISDNNNSNSIKSSDIRANFRNNKKDRYIGLKISVVLGVLLLGLLIYSLYKMKPTQELKANNINASISDSAVVSNAESLINKHPDTIKLVDKINTTTVELSVSGKTPNQVRENLKSLSASYMRNKEYTPVSCKIFLNPQKIIFKLEKKPSDFTKLSLCFGNFDSTTNSCESCLNVLSKNTGSYEIASTKSSNNFIYKVICIKE